MTNASKYSEQFKGLSLPKVLCHFAQVLFDTLQAKSIARTSFAWIFVIKRAKVKTYNGVDMRTW